MSQMIRTSRPLVMGWRGAVASGHPLASQAALEMLRRGGNAADAAVATAASLAVVEPNMSGLGGDGFFLFRSAAGESIVINCSGPAPRGATPERYAGGIPHRGAGSASVPGLVDGWCCLHSRYGRLPLAEVLAPAISYARDGYGATQRLCANIESASSDLAADPGCAEVFLPQGRVPRVGDVIRQPRLAATLGVLASGGRQPFYRGEIAHSLVAFCRQQGGVLDEADLAEYEPEVQEPIQTSYRGYTVLEAPPNSTGHVLLQELNLAERFDLAGMGFLSGDHVHTLVEIKKVAFVDREQFSADPRIVDVPLHDLLSKERAARQAAEIDPRRASSRPLAVGAPAGASDTTYFAVVDGEGAAVSGIQSLNGSFGAASLDPKTGILLNNRMVYWHLEPGHPNRLAPGKRVRHTMNPPMVLRDDRLFLVFGTPGADQQVQVNMQVLTAIIDFGLDPQEAVEMPRWRCFQVGGESDWPHGDSDHLVMENTFPEATRRELANRGHRVQVVGSLDGGCNVQAIQVHPEHGLLMAASDPRRDGYALAL